MKDRYGLTVALFVLVCGTIWAGDWPGWRGLTGVGLTGEKELPLTWGGKKNENVLWHVKLEGRGYSSPIVWKDRVLVTMTLPQTDAEVKNKAVPEHRVACYRAADGKSLWTAKVPAGPYRTDNYSVPTPATDGQRVYVWFGSAVLAALDFEGKVLWRREWKGPFFLNPAMSSSPVVYKDSVILMCTHNGKEDSFLRAVDSKTGEDRWVKPRPSAGTNNATPVLIGVKGKSQMIVSLARGVESIDPENGELLWKCPAKGFVPSPSFGEGLLYIDNGVEGPGEAIDPTGSGDVGKSHIRWQVPKLQWSYASTVIAGDYLYRAAKPGLVTCRRVSTGEVVYSERLEGVTLVSSPVATADGRIYFACAAKSHVLKAGPKFEVLATNVLPAGDDGPSAAVSEGRLFLKSSGELFCIGKK
jgi:outer membrane protein assembly factor BamB